MSQTELPLAETKPHGVRPHICCAPPPRAPTSLGSSPLLARAEPRRGGPRPSQPADSEPCAAERGAASLREPSDPCPSEPGGWGGVGGQKPGAGMGCGDGTSASVAVTALQGRGRRWGDRGLTSAPPFLSGSPRRRLAERRRVLGLRERERGCGAQRRGGGTGRDPRTAAAGEDGLHRGAGLPAGEDLPAPEVPGGLGAEEAGSCPAALGDPGGCRVLPRPVGQRSQQIHLGVFSWVRSGGASRQGKQPGLSAQPSECFVRS